MTYLQYYSGVALQGLLSNADTELTPSAAHVATSVGPNAGIVERAVELGLDMCVRLNVPADALAFPLAFAQPVENLLKTCENPVDRTRRAEGPYTPTNTVTDGVPRTDRTDYTDHKRQEQTPFNPANHPFQLNGLTESQVAAVGYMVAVFRAMPTPAPLEHGEFNDRLYAIVEAQEPQQAVRDAILREAWNPKFWRSRPEFTVTWETIAPNPAIL